MLRFLRWFLVGATLVLLTACGGGGSTVEEEVVNTAPVAKTLEATTYEESSYSGMLEGSDSEDKYLKYYLVTPPSHGVVTIEETSGYFTYIPETGYNGDDHFFYKVFDGDEYSSVAEVAIHVVTPVASSADTTASTAPILVNVTRPSTDSIVLYWLAAVDAQTEAEKMRYEVHLATEPRFDPTESTRKLTTTGTLEATVDALQEQTTYYVKIVAIDSGDHHVISNELNITTASSSDTIISQPDKIKRSDDLFLHDATEVTDDKIVYPKTEQTLIPKSGDVLFGDAEDRVLRKVIDVTEADDSITIHTQKASFNEVVERATIETTTLLVDQEDLATQQSSKMMKITTYNSTQNQTDTYHWQSGHFAINREHDIAVLSNTSTAPTPVKMLNSISDSDDDLSITVAQEKLIAYVGRLNFLDVEAKETDPNEVIDQFHITSIVHNDVEIPCNASGTECGIFRLEYDWSDPADVKAKLIIDNPSESDISSDPYEVTLYAYSDDTTLFGVDDSVEVTFEVYIVSDDLDIDANKDYDLDYGISADVSFTPTVSTKIDIDGSSITYGKISVGGRLQLDIHEFIKFETAKELDKTFDLGSKNFTQVYMVAGVPVYQEITIGWSAQITGSISGEIEQNIDLTKIYDASFGMEYVNGSWQALKSTGDYSNLTAKISLGAKGELEVRLIPEITITFYRAVSSGMSIEPWGKVAFEAHGEVVATTDFESYDTMVQYGLDTLDATGCQDVRQSRCV